MDLITKRVSLIISLSIIVLVIIAEVWWHHTPILQRLDKSSYYAVLVSTADERAAKGDLRGAEDLLNTAIRKFPDTPDAYEALGDLLAREGNKARALTNYALAMQFLGKGFTNVLFVTQQLAERPFIESKMLNLR